MAVMTTNSICYSRCLADLLSDAPALPYRSAGGMYMAGSTIAFGAPAAVSSGTCCVALNCVLHTCIASNTSDSWAPLTGCISTGCRSTEAQQCTLPSNHAPFADQSGD